MRASARSRVCFSRRTRIEEASEWAGSEQALSPEWMPASSMCSMMPAMKVSRAVAEAVDVDLDGVGQVAVDQQRPLVGDDELGGLVEGGRQPRHVAVDLGPVGDDLHGPAAQHIGRADHHGIAELVGDAARLGGRAGDAALGLLELEPVDQRLEPVAVLGQVDGVGRGAEDRHARLLQRVRRA